MPTPTTEAAVDPTVVPDRITIAYLDAVMEEMDRLEAQVHRIVAESGDVMDPSAVELYADLIGPDTAIPSLRDIEDHFGVDALADPPRPPETSVLEVLDESRDCILFTAEHDLTPMFDEDVEIDLPSPWYFRLRPHEANDQNPLPWRRDYGRALGSHQTPPSTCEEVDDL